MSKFTNGLKCTAFYGGAGEWHLELFPTLSDLFIKTNSRRRQVYLCRSRQPRHVQIGRSLSQCFRAPLHKGDRIAVSQDFDRALRRLVYPPSLRFFQDELADFPLWRESRFRKVARVSPGRE